MWIAEERDSYKRHLAATLFADVLQKGQSVDLYDQTTASGSRLLLYIEK